VQVGDLSFELSVNGARRVESAINDVRDALIEAQAAVEALDGRTIDLDLDVDRDAIENALSGAVAVGGGSAVGGAADAAAEATSEAADAASDAATSWDQVTGQNQSYARILSRLNDEAFAVSGLLQKLPAAVSATALGLGTLAVSLGTTVAAVGGLAAAATGLATQFGDVDIQSDLLKLKGALQGVARRFVDAFEPIIRNQVIPGALALAAEFESVIPRLQSLTKTWLPSLIETVVFLVDELVSFIEGAATIANAFNKLKEAVEGFAAFLALMISNLADSVSNELGFGDVVKDVNRQAQRRQLGEGLVAIGALERDTTEQEETLKRIREAIEDFRGSISGDIKEFEDVRKEVEGIREAMNETTEAGRPLVSQAEGLKSQFRLVQDALTSMAKQGLGDTSQFEEFKGLLEEIRGRAKAAGVELGTTVEQAKELPEIETFSDRLSQFREATRGVMEGGQAPVAPPEGPVPSQVSAPQVPIDQLRQLAQTASSIEEVNSLLAITSRKMESVGTEGKIALQGIQGSLKITREQLQNSTDQVEQFTKKLKQVSVKQFLRLGDAIAKNLVSGVSDAVTGLSKVEQIQKRLSKLQLRQQIQNLRGRLKEATGIDAQVINTRIDLLTKQLEEARNEAGRLGQVFQKVGNAILSTLESVIQEVIALIAKMLIIKAIKAVISGGSSFALGSISGIGANGVLTNPGVGDILGSLNAASTVPSAPLAGVSGTAAATATTGTTRTASLQGGDVIIPGELVDQAAQAGSRRRGRTGR
jgi:hypothetical protein